MEVPRITAEEMSLVINFVIFPIMLDYLEADINHMKVPGLTMALVHIAHLRKVQDGITLELTNIRKELRKAGIKVIDQIETKDGMEYNYLCRGYRSKLNLMFSLMKAETTIYLCKVLNLDITQLGVLNEQRKV